jgi:tetratricopeptide (TPR) repeat protein
MRAWGLLVLPLLLAGLVAGACQNASVPAPAAEADLPTLAARALDAGDYERAADLYRRAIAREPESVPLRYGLGVAASHLGRREEAVRELTWVLDKGEPGSREVRAAEQWLRSVGALRRPTQVASPKAPEPEQVHGRGGLEGRAVLAAADSPNDLQPARRLKLSLIGEPNSPTKEARYTVRTDENGRYRFPNAIPGPYRLTDRLAGPPNWRLRVEVKAGVSQSLDLTPANRVSVRDDFPQ